MRIGADSEEPDVPWRIGLREIGRATGIDPADLDEYVTRSRRKQRRRPVFS